MNSTDTKFSNRAILLLFLPIAGELMLHYTVGIVDSIMVAKVGEAAVSGVSLMDFVISFFNSLFTALAIGGSVVIGQYLGNKQRANGSDASAQIVTVMVIVGTAITAIVYLLRPFIINSLFGNLAPDVRYHANIYFTITAASLPFMGIYSAGAAVYRSIGNTVLPMRIMIITNLLNVAGNALLIFGFKMGTAGIAIPTLAVRILAAAVIISMLVIRSHRLHIPIHFSLSASIVKKFIKIGVPYSFENGMFYLGRVLVLIMVASFGTASIAANAVAQAVVLFQVLPGMAAVTGMTVIISRCVGAGDFESAKLYNRRIVIGIYIAQTISCALVIAVLPLILKIYGLSFEATSMTRQIVLIHAAFTVVLWPMSYALPATFRAAGDTKFPMIVSVICMLLCRVGFSYLLGVVVGWGVVGVWLGMFIDWIVKGIIFIIRFVSGKWKNYRLVE